MTLPLGGPLHPGWASCQAGLGTEPNLGIMPGRDCSPCWPCDEDRVWASGLPMGFTWQMQPHSLEGLWVGTAYLLLKGAIL